MFDLLKKKLGKFAEKVKKKTEKQKEEPQQEPPAQETKAIKEKPVSEKPEAKKRPKIEPRAEKEAVEQRPEIPEEKTPKPEIEKAQEPLAEEQASEKKETQKARKIKPSISVKGRLKAAITGTVQLQEQDLKGLLWELELALLEADVEQTTAEEICREIKERFLGKKLSKKEGIEKAVKKEISEILLSMMKTEPRDVIKEIKEKKEPYKMLFLGPNGAGKTTSIAKITKLLQGQNLKVIWAAGDTFRAASIEQLEKHAASLGVRVVKHQYGSDPAAVAFDAVKAAKSKKIDVVLIDSAGRQETNRNLMGELQKIVRVVQPDLKVYVGEAFTGQALLQQATEYDKAIGLDGFILSKIDCDSKGGTTISLLYKLKKPVLFIGTGQEYKDLEKFEPEFVVKQVIG